MNGGALIVGASLGGLRLAEQLRAAGYSGPMTIAGSEPHMPYNRPPLSKDTLFAAAAGELIGDPKTGLLAGLAFPLRSSIADIQWLLGSAAVSADLDRREVALADGRKLAYSVLGIATGLSPRRLPMPGAEPDRFVLRTIEDARRLGAALRPEARVVIAGGGFIGCEVAATARKLGCRVTVVEPLALPMCGVIGMELAQAFRLYHESHGVEFRLGVSVSGIETRSSAPGRLSAVMLSDGSSLEANVLVEAIGSTCNVDWLSGNGLDLSDGVLTDHWMRVEGRPDVVAAGDVARFPIPRYGPAPRRIEHWSISGLTARRAAAALNATLSRSPLAESAFDPMPSFWTDQFDVRLQSFGIPALAERNAILEGTFDELGKPGRGLAAGYWRGDTLVGVICINLAAAQLVTYKAMLG